MGSRVPLEDLPPDYRVRIQPGTPAFSAYASDYEDKYGLPRGSIASAKLQFQPGTDPRSLLTAIALDKQKSLGIRPQPQVSDSAATTTPQTASLPEPSYSPLDGMSVFDRIAAGAGKSVADTWTGLKQIAGYGNQADIDERARLDAPLVNDPAGLGGYVGGTGLQMLVPASGVAKGAAALRAVPALARAAPVLLPAATGPVAQGVALGAASGATQPVVTGGDRLSNAEEGGALGGAGATVGKLIAAAGTAVKGSKAAQLLADKADQLGIPLRAAQLSDNPLTQSITKLADLLPFSGSRSLTAEQQAGFNRALSRTIGADTDAPIQALRDARGNITKMYDDVKSGNNLQLEPWHVDALTDTQNAFAPLDVTKGQEGVHTLDTLRRAIVNATDDNGQMDGATYKSLRSKIGALQNDAKDPDLKSALGDYKGTLDKAFRSGLSPADNFKLSQADKYWSNMKTLEKIAPASSEGDFDFGKLATVLGNKSRANSSSKNAFIYGFGDQELPDLANIGTTFLSRGVTGSPAGPLDWTKRLASAAIQPVGVGTALGGTYALNHDDDHPILKSVAELGALGLAGRALGKGVNSSWMLNGSGPMRLTGNVVQASAPALVGGLNAVRAGLPIPAQQEGQP